MLGEFRTFIERGNVLDLAVGVIIGAAFARIIGSLTDDVLMPLIGLITGGMDFSAKFIVLGSVPSDYRGSLENYAALKQAGVAMLGYGAFLTAIINFLIMAFVVFLIVRQANRLLAPKVVVPTGPTEIELLTEIRDSLQRT
ncbi:MAG: large conductance mechanosensitive channel protein MscL [Pseudomonadota bacterium]